MSLHEEELKELLDPRIDIEKKTKLSHDGDNLVMRVPRIIEKELNLQKGQSIVWKLHKNETKIILEVANGKA